MANRDLDEWLQKCNPALRILFEEMDSYLSALPEIVTYYWRDRQYKYGLQSMQKDHATQFYSFMGVHIKPGKNELYLMFKNGVNDRRNITQPGTAWEPTFTHHYSVTDHAEMQKAVELMIWEYGRFMRSEGRIH